MSYITKKILALMMTLGATSLALQAIQVHDDALWEARVHRVVAAVYGGAQSSTLGKDQSAWKDITAVVREDLKKNKKISIKSPLPSYYNIGDPLPGVVKHLDVYTLNADGTMSSFSVKDGESTDWSFPASEDRLAAVKVVDFHSLMALNGAYQGELAVAQREKADKDNIGRTWETRHAVRKAEVVAQAKVNAVKASLKGLFQGVIFTGKSSDSLVKDKPFKGTFSGKDIGNVRSAVILQIADSAAATLDAVCFMRGRAASAYAASIFSCKATNGIQELTAMYNDNVASPRAVSFMINNKPCFGILFTNSISRTDFAVYGVANNATLKVHEVAAAGSWEQNFTAVGITNIKDIKPTEQVFATATSVVAPVAPAAQPAQVVAYRHDHAVEKSRVVNVNGLKFAHPGNGAFTFKARGLNDLHVMVSDKPGVATEKRGVNTPGAGTHAVWIIGGHNNDRSWMRYTIAGANPTSPMLTKAANANAVITGGRPSDGTLWDSYWIKLDNNGKRMSWGKGAVVGQNELQRYEHATGAPTAQYIYIGGHDNASIEFAALKVEDIQPSSVVSPQTLAQITSGAILEARYGAQNGWSDQKQRLAEMLMRDKKIDIVVTNAAMGGDPKSGVVKELIVKVLDAGKEQTFTTREGQRFTYIPSQPAQVVPAPISLPIVEAAPAPTAIPAPAPIVREYKSAVVKPAVVREEINFPQGFILEGGRLLSVAVGAHNGKLLVIGLGIDRKLYNFNEESDKAVAWVRRGEELFEDISCSSDGFIAAATVDGDVVVWDWNGNKWNKLDKPMSVKFHQVTTGNIHNLWAVDNNTNDIYERTATGWILRSKGVGAQVSAGYDNTVAALNVEGKAYLWKDNGWHQLASTILSDIIVVNAQVIYGIDDQGYLLRYNPTTSIFESVLGVNGRPTRGVDSMATNAGELTTIIIAKDGSVHRKGSAAPAVTSAATIVSTPVFATKVTKQAPRDVAIAQKKVEIKPTPKEVVVPASLPVTATKKKRRARKSKARKTKSAPKVAGKAEQPSAAAKAKAPTKKTAKKKVKKGASKKAGKKRAKTSAAKKAAQTAAVVTATDKKVTTSKKTKKRASKKKVASAKKTVSKKKPASRKKVASKKK